MEFIKLKSILTKMSYDLGKLENILKDSKIY